MALAVWRLGMPTGTAKFRARDRAVSDFMAALALPDQRAARGTQQIRATARSNCGAIQATAGSASRKRGDLEKQCARDRRRDDCPAGGRAPSRISSPAVRRASARRAAAGMSSQCPLQTEASSSQAAEMVKIDAVSTCRLRCRFTPFSMFSPAAGGRMNEAETRAELIEPALRGAGWGVVADSRDPPRDDLSRPHRRRRTARQAGYKEGIASRLGREGFPDRNSSPRSAA